MIEQAHLVNLDDDQLLDYLGFCYEEIKNLEEKLKNDPQILEMEQELKDLKNERYNDSIKGYKAQLRASRALAKAKGLKFKIPKELNDE